MSRSIERLRALWGALGIVVAAGVVALILPLVVFAALALAGAEPTPSAEIALSVVLVQGVSMGGVALLYLAARPGRLEVPVRWPTARDLQWMVGGTALALAAMFVGSIALALAGAEPGTHQLQEAGEADPAIFAILIPLSFLLIGPGEELLFRGVVQGRLRQAFGPAAAIVLAAAIFAALHVMALTGPLSARLAGVAVLVLPSLVFGLSYERSRNIAVPAVVHGGYNAVLLTLSYYAVELEEAGAM